MSLTVPDFSRFFQRHVVVDEQRRGWLDYRLATGGAAEIVNIEVDPRHRRAGVGRALLAQMIAELPANIAAVYAFTSSTNAPAHAWYQALGFELHFVPGLYRSMNEDAYCCVRVVRH